MRNLLLGLIALLFCTCSATDYTNRSQIMLMSPQEEVALGTQSAKEILRSSKISNNKAQTAMIQRVGGKIAKVANRPDFQWEFYLLEDKRFVCPVVKYLSIQALCHLSQAMMN